MAEVEGTVLEDVTLLDGVFAPDERAVILSERFAHAAIASGDLAEAVQKALAMMALSGQRVAYLDLGPAAAPKAHDPGNPTREEVG